jgi:hypothetical protein
MARKEDLITERERADDLARKLDVELLRHDTEKGIWETLLREALAHYDATQLALQAEREKAALAGEMATHIHQADGIPGIHLPSFESDWLARYDALVTPTTEAACECIGKECCCPNCEHYCAVHQPQIWHESRKLTYPHAPTTEEGK